MKAVNLKKNFENVFGFLESKYGFITLESNIEDWGYHFVALNLTTGVEIKYEFREAIVQVIVYKLVEGKIVKNVMSAINSDEEILGFSLDWILSLKNPNEVIKPAYEYGKNSLYYDENDGLKNYLLLIAEKLQTYAEDLLIGNFSMFSDLNFMVKNNYKNINSKHL